MTNEESARDLLGEVLKCGGTANGKIVLAAALREAEARGLERGAEVFEKRADEWRALALKYRSKIIPNHDNIAVADDERQHAAAAATALRAEAARVREGKP